MKAACRAWEQLEAWADLTAGPASCGQGQALVADGGDIAHLHNDHDADLYLTDEAIGRMRIELEHSTAVRLYPGTGWVTLRLDCDQDAELMVSLVSVALQAHARHRPMPAASLCNRGRITIMPTGQGSPSAEQSELPRRIRVPRLTRGRSRSQGQRTA
ncbi:luciferase family protein [Streptacidiphilus sp. EB103A]|uniref:luciferase domain-containing protein n=1 Tax=Streptacidiphilus sp. EB103A TaxID=3156275 RepID=UPI00351139AC